MTLAARPTPPPASVSSARLLVPPKWTTQQARNLVTDLQDAGTHPDSGYTATFGAVFRSGGIAIVKT